MAVIPLILVVLAGCLVASNVEDHVQGQWGMVAVSAEPIKEARALVKDRLLAE